MEQTLRNIDQVLGTIGVRCRVDVIQTSPIIIKFYNILGTNLEPTSLIRRTFNCATESDFLFWQEGSGVYVKIIG